MSEKNKSKIWHTAVTHAFITGLVFPWIASYIFKLIINNFYLSYLVMYALAILLSAIAIWFGAIVSVKNIKVNFNAEEVKRLIKLSSVYFVLIQIISYFLYASMSADPIRLLKVGIIQLIVLTIVFYIASKKYIKVSESPLVRPMGEAEKS